MGVIITTPSNMYSWFVSSVMFETYG